MQKEPNMLKFSSYRLALIFVVSSLAFHSVSPTSISREETNITADVTSNIYPIDVETGPSECKLPRYVSIKGRHYYFGLDLKLTHSDASKHCQKLNMELVSIEDCEEDNYLTNMIKDAGRDCYNLSYWTSGYRKNEYFYWGTEAPFVYTSWLSGEPNNMNKIENCVDIKQYNLQWNDAHCSNTQHFICESANNPKMY